MRWYISRYYSCICHRVTGWPWISHINPLGLPFFISKLRDLDETLYFYSVILIVLVALKGPDRHAIPSISRRGQKKSLKALRSTLIPVTSINTCLWESLLSVSFPWFLRLDQVLRQVFFLKDQNRDALSALDLFVKCKTLSQLLSKGKLPVRGDTNV